MQSKGVRREAVRGNEDACVESSLNRLYVAMKLYLALLDDNLHAE